jgi:hypothetical protein
MPQVKEWTYITGSADHDRWVMVSPDGKVFLIGEYESNEGGIKKTVRIEKL